MIESIEIIQRDEHDLSGRLFYNYFMQCYCYFDIMLHTIYFMNI